MTSVVYGGLSELEANSDPVFAALGAFRNAGQIHATALLELDGAFLARCEPSTQAMIAWQLYRLPDIEAAEFAAHEVLHNAEKAVLNAHPSTLEGSIALLCFLQSYLADDPDLGLAIQGIADVEAVLLSFA